MRILRGKSNLEVSSQGFAWFVIGLVLATFIGGAVRTVLSSDRVHQRIVSELKNRLPNHEIEIGQTEVLLSQGLWPGLGLRLRNVKFRQDACGKLSFTLNVPIAVLPVDILNLRNGVFRLKRLQLENGQADFSFRPCVPATSAGAEMGVAKQKNEVDTVRPKLSVAALDGRRLGKYLDAIELREFSLTYEQHPTWKILVKNLDLNLGADLSGEGLLEVQKSLPFGTLVHVVELESHGDDHVFQWAVQSEFKEGHVSLRGSLDLDSGASVIEAGVRQLPLKEVLSELFQMGMLDREIKLKTTWLSCSLNWEGQIAQMANAPVGARDCKMEGAYGRVNIERADIWPLQADLFKTAARMQVDRLQVQPMLEALNRQVLPAVLAKPGVWSGQIEFLNAQTWKLDGHLEDAEVLFSNRSVRGKQTVETIHTVLEKTNSKVMVSLDDAVIQGGEFAGHMKMILNDDLRNGTFSVQIEKFRLSPTIQNLLVGGSIGTLKLTGNGNLQAGELGFWNGQFILDSVQGLGWQTGRVELDSRFSSGAFKVTGRADLLTASENWPAYPQLKRIYPNLPEQVNWKDLKMQVDLSANGGVLQSSSGVETASAQVWKFKGAWVRDGLLTGNLSIGGRTFTVRGEKGMVAVQSDRD